MCNPTSYYPNKIDEMIFFQDNDLEKVQIMDHYNELIAQGKYDEANDYISHQENVYGFFSDFFNLIENRIYNLQEYLLSKSPKKQPFIYYDEKAYPPPDIVIFSDTDEIEDLDNIKLFHSDNEDDLEDFECLHVFTNDEELEKEELEPPNLNEDTIWI